MIIPLQPIVQALAELKEFAENGNMDAQWELAQYYWENPECGTPYDGIDWARKAAEQGHPEAELYVGEYCEHHLDEPQAAMWYERAAEHGNVLGDYHLGLYYKEGRGGLPHDLKCAETCFLRASEYVEAAYEYYDCFRKRIGDSESDDWEYAVALLIRSADGDYAPAQYALGILSESAERFEDAQSYLEAAAKQEYPLAVEYLKATADKKYATTYAELAQQCIDAGDYEAALAYLKKGVRRDKAGICSYLYGDFWEHNYKNLLPWNEDRPNTQSRIGMAAGWYAYSCMCGHEAAWERLIRCFLIDTCKIGPTPENMKKVEVSYDNAGNLQLTCEDAKTTYFGIKPDW